MFVNPYLKQFLRYPLAYFDGLRLRMTEQHKFTVIITPTDTFTYQ